MKKLLTILVVLCLCCACCFSQDINRKKFSSQDLNQDIDKLVLIMTENHPALYAFTPKPQFDKLIDEQRKKIEPTNTLAEAFAIMAPIVARIGCSHSVLRLGDNWNNPGATVLPIKVLLSGDSCFVTESIDPQLVKGTRITRINGKPIAQVIYTIGTWISTDGSNPSARQHRLQSEFGDWVGIHEGFCSEYLLNTVNGAVEKAVKIKGKRWTPSSSNTGGRSLRLKIRPAESAAVLTIKTFGFYNRVDEFKRFIDSSFLSIKKGKVTRLVLDLRGNGGGDPWCSSYLLQHLLTKPFTYFEPLTGNYEPLSKTLPVAANGFTGKLVILVDGGCSSSTGHFCALLKYHRVGNFIGTETEGTYTCNDNSGSFSLPKTNLTARMARTTFSVKVSGVKRFSGIQPDLPLSPTSADVMGRADTILERAIEWSMKK